MPTPSMTFPDAARGRGVFVALLLVAACTAAPEPATTSTTATTTPTTSASEQSTTAPSAESTTTTSVATTTDPSVGSLLVIGDWGTGTEAQAAVAEAMAAYAGSNEVAAILTTGDNFYADRTQVLMEPMDWALQLDIPFWVAWGNHDVETSSRIDVVNETFGSPPRWSVHRWGEVEVVILDSNQVGTTEQLEFLTATLGASEAPTLVVFHHPALSCGGVQDSHAVLETWVPRFDDDVVMVLSGHDHNYQRFTEGGITYVVSGGGGATLYELVTCPQGHPERRAAEAVHHFVALTQEEGVVTAEVIDGAGVVIDEFVIELS